MRYRFTRYFDRVLVERPYLTREQCIFTVAHALRSERQSDNRYRFWAEIPEQPGLFLRVVTLEDKVTIHNAFLDRRFKL